ncbi:MAG TPA: single-stranded-DNA-specific exonuclease RecJ [Gemmataceae bacterium]|nr:single-stranded-DNA-specific exonuclease RecJ [Gemmataceae bacterium]
MSAVQKTWQLLPHDPAAVERLAAALRLSPVVAQLLLNRGLAEPDKARRFLQAPLTGLHAPELLPGAAEAAARLLDAVRRGRRVCVYGDYDVDGVTGTAILLQGLRLLGAQPDVYVPHRLEEGYGLNAEALRQIARQGAEVVITVDCGIGSVAEAEEAKRLGLELIITDHHEPRERLPEAAVLVHPRLPSGSYPFPYLSGSAVAFKVAWALCQLDCGSPRVTPRHREYLLDSVALAALGTVADVVPLHDENRILVRHGLVRLRQAPTPGLKALLEGAGLGDRPELRAADIGYRLAPRLNAAGRLACARLVVELLTTPSPQRALDLARYLEGQNEQRQVLERRMLSQAREMVSASDGAPALVLASPEWHAGVIGIVAGRLAELYARPALLIALRREGPEEGEIGQGSGRSVPGFALHEALRACAAHLLSHGGHKGAAGFRIRAGQIDAFRECFCAYAARHFPSGPPVPRLLIDAEVPLSALTMPLVRDLDQLEPYGMDNPQPVFLAGGVQVTGQPRRVGGGDRHLMFQVRQEGTTLQAVAWGMAERFDELMSAGGQCSLVFTPEINEFNGYRSVRLVVTDFQPGPQAQLEIAPRSLD